MMKLAHISAKFWLLASLALCCGAIRPVQAQAHSATTPAPATKPATHAAHPSSAAKPQTKPKTQAKAKPQTKPQDKPAMMASARPAAKPKPQHAKAAKTAKAAKSEKSAKPARSAKAAKTAPAAQQKKTPAKAPAASVPAAPASPVTQAEPVENKRDPFLPLLRPKSSGGGPEHLPPGKAGLVVSTVRIDGTVEEQNQMIAVVSNPEDKVYFIREGDLLYDGEVEKINLDGVTFKETSKDAFGKPVERTVTKRIYASAGESQ